MEEGEYYVSVPFMDADGNVEYAEIVVPVYYGYTMADVDVAIHDAITEAILNPQTDYDTRMSTVVGADGVDVVYNNVGEYDYKITGFNAGGEFFEFGD